MKLKQMLFMFLTICFFIPLSVQANADVQHNRVGNLTVLVSGIKNNQGVIRIALYKNQQSFEAKDPQGVQAYKKATLTINNRTAVWRLSDISYGYYGVKLFHDEDKSGKLKRNFIGRPQEGVGFSQNPKLTHSPTFDETKFAINKVETKITIDMVNF